jgi:hypothetical protein
MWQLVGIKILYAIDQWVWKVACTYLYTKICSKILPLKLYVCLGNIFFMIVAIATMLLIFISLGEWFE